MSATLYQFPISHYCEKARWALDYKGLPWKPVNLLPGLHVRTTRAMAARSSVPVLAMDGAIVQGSADIISWLDEHYPERSLTPADPVARDQALAWEKRLDKDLGVHVRRFAYHTLLDHPAIVVPLLASGAGWWAGPMLRLGFTRLQSLMRKRMQIDAEGAEQSRQVIEQTLADINATLSRQPFLAGDSFSRADLAAAALAAPLFMPDGYGLKWPEQAPEPFAGWIAAHAQSLDWGRNFYTQYR